MELWLHRLISFYFSIIAAILKGNFYPLNKLQWFPIFIPLIDQILSFYFRYCNLSPCTVDLDDQTTVHFWVPCHRKFGKPNLVLIHGYGADAKWQFLFQVSALAQSFNLFIPDLLFFGKSYTNRGDRTEVFQAKCLCEGLKRLGLESYSLYAISYGGFVGYRMAEMSPGAVDKVVILSSGLGYTEEQKNQHLRKIEKDALDLLLPQKPDDLRMLVNLSFCKYNPVKWVPDIFLHEYINVMCTTNRKEKGDLAEHLLANKSNCDLPILKQETLLIWGDKDMVFPLSFGYQLQRLLAPNAKLEIVKDSGHAANLESPNLVVDLILAFFFGFNRKTKLCS